MDARCLFNRMTRVSSLLLLVSLVGLFNHKPVSGLEVSETLDSATTLSETVASSSEESTETPAQDSDISSASSSLSSTSSSSSATVESSTSSSSLVPAFVQNEIQTKPAASSIESGALYRLYHPELRVHLYTRDANEYKVLGSRNWKQEGVAWQTSTGEGESVYRLYHSDLRVHLYTKDKNEYQVLASRGWKQEGEAYRSFGSLPIYRLYHPGLQRHLYTRDGNEYKVLGSRGWKQEGIAFYGIRSDETNALQSSNQPATNVSASPKQVLPKPKLTVKRIDQVNGLFEVAIQAGSVPSDVTQVLMPVWTSDNGQDDLMWYRAVRQIDGSYMAIVNSYNHKTSTGEYNIHLYFVSDHQSKAITSLKTTLSISRQTNPRAGVIAAARNLLGARHGELEHTLLVNDYNRVEPRPVNYTVKYSDDWCDVFVTTIFQRLGLSNLIGRECGVERHVQIFKELGIWNENGYTIPRAGDLIVFNWDDDTQPNDGFSDHIGIVEKVERNYIHTIEGNSGDERIVRRRVYKVGDGNIRGFASPRY